MDSDDLRLCSACADAHVGLILPCPHMLHVCSVFSSVTLKSCRFSICRFYDSINKIIILLSAFVEDFAINFLIFRRMTLDRS